MIEEYGLPTSHCAENALIALDTLGPLDADASEKLLTLKDRFALGWSALALQEGANFQQLGKLQSQFAAASIDVALNIAWNTEIKVLNLKNISETAQGLFIFGLGKLGGLDLNFSSDVDLVAFYDPEALPIPEHMGQGYIVSKILKTMTQILKPRNNPRFIWRVDWRLRPEASSTQLALPINMAQDFYFFRALPWHRLALMKARIIAGDIQCGEKFLNTITPFIWRQNLDFRALDELAHLKSRINLEHPALRQQRQASNPITETLEGFNVKLGAGGIREIEFIANAQQLIWGGKHYELRTSNTLEALSYLAELGHLDKITNQKLRAYYIELRQLENAIQMLDNEQNHIVPQSVESQQNIMTLLGHTNWEIYTKKIETTRRFVNTEFLKIFEHKEPQENLSHQLETKLSTLSPAVSPIAKNWLDGFISPQINSKNNVNYQLLGTSLLKQIFHSTAAPENAILQINTFFSELSRSEQYLRLLSRDKDLLNALIPPLLHSEHMSLLLQQSPHIIDAFLSPQQDMNTAFIFQSSNYETRLERLRRFVNENLFLDYTEFMGPNGTSHRLHHHLTLLADMTVDAALKIVADDLRIDSLPMTVLGLGKMGTSRMSPLSDLDLVFIFADETDTDLAHKVVRRLRTVLTAKLSEGIAYELDMRLRPSGRSGPPAVMLSSFESYHNERAYNWEHIALAHSRIIAGDEKLGQDVITIRDAVLSRPRETSQFHSDAYTMWQRISDQRLSETPASVFNSKLRPGGLMQAEYCEACNIILGQDITPLAQPITFWSQMQLWERLLGLTGKSLNEIPPFYLESFLNQTSCKTISDISRQKAEYSQSVQEDFNKSLKAPADIELKESRILWTD